MLDGGSILNQMQEDDALNKMNEKKSMICSHRILLDSGTVQAKDYEE